MKLVCYSLFSGKAEPFEAAAYVRGFYWNARMNNFLYPDWRTHLEVDRVIYSKYQALFDWLVGNNCLDLKVNEETPPLCEGMLWRMKPAFTIDVSHILCRDSDSITTHREAWAVQKWIESGLGVHSILDNPAHGGLMGGMVGFDTAKLKAYMQWHSFDDVIRGYNLSERGSDQHLMNQRIGPIMAAETMTHSSIDVNLKAELPGVHPAMWESNLVCRHIGSAGVVDMEVLRFFIRHDIYNWKFQPIEKEFPQLFYWHQ